MTAARKPRPEPWILLADGVFQGRARTAGELMKRKGLRGAVKIVNEADGIAYHRSLDRRQRVRWRRDRLVLS